jgi:hypothetical protein
LAILEEQIAIAASRDNPRETPARPALATLLHGSSRRAFFGLASFAHASQPPPASPVFLCGSTPLTPIVIFPSKAAKVILLAKEST